MFDLNWRWLEIRGEMERAYGREDDIVTNILVEIIVLVALFGAYLVSNFCRDPQVEGIPCFFR